MKKQDQNQKSGSRQLDRKREGNFYDKIMRENLKQIFLPLVEKQLHIKIKSVKPLPDKQETTLERETDAFLLIETNEGEKFILHLEFQVKDDPDMIYRMIEHHGIELRKYKLLIKHVVIYLGEREPKMATELKPEEVFRSFELVNVHEFTPDKWLSSQVPEEIILAVLSDYPKKDAERILAAIFDKLKRVCATPNKLGKFIKQLIILSRLRNLESLTIKISEAMPLLIDIEKDGLYLMGLEKGKKLLEKEQQKAHNEKKATIVKMLGAGLKIGQIANFLNLSEKEAKAFLKEIENDKKAKKKN